MNINIINSVIKLKKILNIKYKLLKYRQINITNKSTKLLKIKI